MLRTFFRQRTISDNKMVITCDQIMSAIPWMYISFYGCDTEWTLGNMDTGAR